MQHLSNATFFLFQRITRTRLLFSQYRVLISIDMKKSISSAICVLRGYFNPQNILILFCFVFFSSALWFSKIANSWNKIAMLKKKRQHTFLFRMCYSLIQIQRFYQNLVMFTIIISIIHDRAPGKNKIYETLCKICSWCYYTNWKGEVQFILILEHIKS